MEEMPTKKSKKRLAVVVIPGKSDEAAMKEAHADPSTVIPIESSDEDWDDSDKEDEGCEDPDKDEFWEQFRNSDDEE
ncbi:hypothetical protein D1007_31100 [Hordeum vulgare]|nr:hypothetical protein D1007_31100 [Hordeum vulgare]